MVQFSTTTANFFSQKNIVPLIISIGDYQHIENITVVCPNENDPTSPHKFVKNGRDTHLASKPQQFLCRDCKNSFYAHTSKFITDLETELKCVIRESLNKGRITIPALASRLRVSKSLASHLLEKVLEQVTKYIQGHPCFKEKIRMSAVLFVDETFITIGHKTWYLIVAVSGDNHVMGLKLVEHRDDATLLEFIQDCASRLAFDLWLLVTDGLMAYKGVAKTIALEISHPLVHVRHIHKPDYHDIEMNYYEKTVNDLIITSANFWNDIFLQSGGFIATVKERSERIISKSRGRKAGGKNRPKEVIEAEKQEKHNSSKKRGRPPGSTKEKSQGQPQVFVYKEKVGCVETIWHSSEAVAAALNIVLEQFQGLYITSNLVEKEFSVLKELLSFRGRRDVDHWFELLTAYYAIRDDPTLLEKVLCELTISPTTIRHSMASLINTQLGVV
jgi:hypothetical protein